MKQLSTGEIIKWLQPWPIDLTRKDRRDKQWELRIESLNDASDYYYCFGALSRATTIHDVATKLKLSIDKELPDPLGGRGHYVEMLARDYVPTMRSLTIVVDRKYKLWRVIDGNHRSLACLLARMQKRPLQIKAIGVVRECL